MLHHSRFIAAARCSVLLLAATLTGCNERNPLLDAQPPTALGPTAVPANFVTLNLRFSPAAVIGGEPTVGTVVLGPSAAAAGATITLSSADPSVQVPPMLTIPPGVGAAHFPVATSTVAADRSAAITATIGAASVGTVLQLWAVVPVFFSVADEDGGRLGGGFRRFVPENAQFSGNCSESEVNIFITAGSELWVLRFGAPRGAPIRPGLYEGATRTAFRAANTPGIDLGGCNQTTGRFVVHEVEFLPRGPVRRFWATFEQYCDGRPAALRGSIRVRDLQPPTFVSTCILQ